MADVPRWFADVPEYKETRRKRTYRLLQSWYRENKLELGPGANPINKRTDGSWLRQEDVVADPSLNFLGPQVARYVEERIPQVKALGGSLDDYRLRHSLLSSMPLCFNIFGFLRSSEAAASILRGVLQLDVANVETIECEFAPDPAEHLGDRTAFDAFIEYRDSTGDLCFVGVETKYTDSFSPTTYRKPAYDELTNKSGYFLPGAADRLVGSGTNQLWRMALLAASMQGKSASPYSKGFIRVLSTANDLGLGRVARLQEWLLDKSFAGVALLEDFVREGRANAASQGWANDLDERYLDVTPVETIAATTPPRPTSQVPSITAAVPAFAGQASDGNYLLTTDGSGTGTNDDPGPGAIGVILRNPKGVVVETISESIGPATNTVAEYKALIRGLELAKSFGVTRIRVFVDSELLVNQLSGKAAVKAKHLRELRTSAHDLLEGFADKRLSWIPRAWNTEADLLARIALDQLPDDQATDEVGFTPEQDSASPKVVDLEGQISWISEHADLPRAPIESVLELEWEFMIGVGIVDAPDHRFVFYAPEDLEGLPPVVDPQRLTRDAEDILNVPAEIADLILDMEYQYLRMRGIAD